jgi:hypothetical protein
MVTVKSWILALPQYLVVAFFAGAGQFFGAGLIGILTIFAGAPSSWSRAGTRPSSST